MTSIKYLELLNWCLMRFHGFLEAMSWVSAWFLVRYMKRSQDKRTANVS